MTETQLAELCGSNARAAIFADYLIDAMTKFQINTKQRESMFMAQIMHESGGLRWTRELSSGRQYEGRKDLGNVFPGDGAKFKGAGLIMITGRTNFIEASKALFGDTRLVVNPELLTTPQFASYSAAWWWKKHGLNEIADTGDFRRTTKIINGGLNGEVDRDAYYRRASILM